MLFLAHVQGDGIGFSAGGMAVINKSFFLTVWHPNNSYLSAKSAMGILCFQNAAHV